MTSLPERILKLAKFHTGGIHDTYTNGYEMGRKDEHAELLPILKSLAEIIEKQSEALEIFADIGKMGHEDIVMTFVEDSSVIHYATEAIAETQARLKELGCEDE